MEKKIIHKKLNEKKLLNKKDRFSTIIKVDIAIPKKHKK